MPAGRYVEAVTGATFALAPGESLALVGESGCGKSVLASALLGLLPGNAETAGSARLADGLDLLAADERTLARTVRGRRVGLVPQSPAAHLTPVRTVRAHLEETVRERAATGYTGHAAAGTAAEPRSLPDEPGPLPDQPGPSPAGPVPASGPSDGPARRGRRHRLAALRAAARAAAGRAAFPASHLDRHPHELSGGLAQRAATALALVGDAPLLLADEPTTGLDRDLVERTVDELRAHTRADGRALLMITHDLAAARRIADTVAVMYAGRIVEIAPAGAFFGSPGPRHPYARGLLDALPERAFTPVPGAPPELGALPPGCAFAARCAAADPLCRTRRPALTEGVACHHA
ncbi:oligopeptide/dipeptide ABC transporter ATP-binding protein [Streptomyces yangpuensis]|uniref:oligopeptide/dipeptide ABC transporter ATP-binding protein n=1 Tax=Streptomyces yangpuensis TaxID=1648182 RepID=UPI00364D9BDF